MTSIGVQIQEITDPGSNDSMWCNKESQIYPPIPKGTERNLVATAVKRGGGDTRRTPVENCEIRSPYWGSWFKYRGKYYAESNSQGNICTRVAKLSSVKPWWTRQDRAKRLNQIPKAHRLLVNTSEQNGSLKNAILYHRQETKRRQPRHSPNIATYQNTPRAVGSGPSAINITNSQWQWHRQYAWKSKLTPVITQMFYRQGPIPT